MAFSDLFTSPSSVGTGLRPRKIDWQAPPVLQGPPPWLTGRTPGQPLISERALSSPQVREIATTGLGELLRQRKQERRSEAFRVG